MRPLLLVAASGLAGEVVEAVRAAGGPDVVGILDDDPARRGGDLLGVPVLGGLDLVADHPGTDLVLCPGKGASRAAVAARLADRGVTADRYGTVVHPSVQVPASCTIGVGSVLLAGVALTSRVSVGRHVVVMPNAVLTHDDVLGDHATVCAGVVLGGSVVVGPTAYLGMAAAVRERVRIGAGAVVGMGAVVLGDVPDGQVWAGVPARRLVHDRG